MNCTIDAKLITNIVDSIKDLNPFVNFDFTEHGLHMQAMDTGHVSLSSLTLPHDLFQEYVCSRSLTLGVNLKSFLTVLKGSKGSLRLNFANDKLNVNVEKNSGCAKYALNLIDVNSDNLELPEEDYDAKVILSSSIFGKVIREMSEFSDTCSLHISNALTVKSVGDIGSVDWESTDCQCTVQVETEALLFSIPYLLQFAKAHTVASQMLIEMKGEQPLRVTLPIGSGHLRFYLAPKVPDE